MEIDKLEVDDLRRMNFGIAADGMLTCCTGDHPRSEDCDYVLLTGPDTLALVERMRLLLHRGTP